MIPLTELQTRILTAIRDLMNANGYPPSVRQIGAAVGLASDAVVVRQLHLIRFKGWIKPVPGTSAVQILDNPQETSHA